MAWAAEKVKSLKIVCMAGPSSCPRGMGGVKRSGPWLNKPVSIAERIVFPSHLLERLHRLADRHSAAVPLRPASHATEGKILLAIFPRAPQRPLIAGQHHVAMFQSVGEDLVVIGALAQFPEI